MDNVFKLSYNIYQAYKGLAEIGLKKEANIKLNEFLECVKNNQAAKLDMVFSICSEGYDKQEYFNQMNNINYILYKELIFGFLLNESKKYNREAMKYLFRLNIKFNLQEFHLSIQKAFNLPVYSEYVFSKFVIDNFPDCYYAKNRLIHELSKQIHYGLEYFPTIHIDVVDLKNINDEIKIYKVYWLTDLVDRIIEILINYDLENNGESLEQFLISNNYKDIYDWEKVKKY